MMQRSTLITALILGTVACSDPDEAPTSDPVPFAHASYHDDCAPWDGGAVTLYFSDDAVPGPHQPPRPHVSVALYQPLTSLVGSTLRWEGRDDQTGFVAWCPPEGECHEALRVMVRLIRQGPDGVLEGEVRLDFEDGDEVYGTFEAMRIPFEPLCG